MSCAATDHPAPTIMWEEGGTDNRSWELPDKREFKAKVPLAIPRVDL